MKGVDIVVHGSVGHVAGFMAQRGSLVVCGDAGQDLGDSIYETRIYVRGQVASLGADCVEKEMAEEHRAELASLLEAGEAALPGRVSPLRLGPPALQLQRGPRGRVLMAGCRDRACASRRYSTATRFTRSSAWRGRGSTTSAGSAPSAGCRISTICCSSARASRDIRSRDIASAARPTSRWGHGSRRADRARDPDHDRRDELRSPLGPGEGGAGEGCERGGDQHDHRRRRDAARRSASTPASSSTKCCPRVTG